MRAFALRCDVTDEASVRAMMKEAGRELGRIDILVNNAANYETAEFEKLTVRQWDAIFASNTRGPFLVSREALKWMRRKRGKRRGQSKRRSSTWDRWAGWAVGDACALLLVEGGAAHVDEGDGESPGAGDRGERRGAGDDRSRRKVGGGLHAAAWRSRRPCGATARGDEIAAAVLFFATAPQFITGQILAVDGGLGL